VRLPPATAALLLLLSGTAAAQALPPPRLVIRAAEAPITVASLDVQVLIHGLAAETTETIVFHNPNARVLEGELEFPLPDGAAVTGFGLDVEGKLVDGVVVEKQQARVILETEIRKGVDPGLVEHVRGNVYRTRIYPIPARGTRTVRLRWVSPLTTQGDEAAYHLPLPYKERLPALALRVEVVRPPVTPEVKGGFGNLTLAKQSDRWVAEARLSDAPADRDLLVRLPRLPASWSALEAAGDAEAFFSVAALLPVVQLAAPPPGPSRVAVAWDASGSRGPVATAKELAFLRQLLAAWPSTAVDLVVFRDRPEKPVAFAAGAWTRLEAFLRALPSDGGTALAALDLRRAALPSRDDALWILCSDGLGTLGESLPPAGDVPVWSATGATEADRALLRHLAAATGGRLLDLVAAEPGVAVSTLRGPQARVVQVSASPAGAAVDLQRREGADPGRLTITGRLVAPEAELTLLVDPGDGKVQRLTVKLRRADAVQGDGTPGPVAVTWAQGKAEVLGIFADKNGDELLALGRRFGVVTAGTSILVLETLQQHLQYGVEPAATRPELRAQYLAAVGDQLQLRKAAEKDALEAVVAAWKARVDWWEKKYDVPAGWKWREDKPKKARASAPGRMMRNGDGADREEMMEMAAPAAAPPAPGEAVAAKAMAGKDEAGRGTEASISIQPWDPQVPWIAALKAAKPGKAYDAYLAEKAKRSGPGFYLDCAGFFLRTGERALGLRVLTNLAELRLDDAALLRVLAWRLSEAGELDQAAEVLEKVLRLRPEEPQSRRDLALVLADRAEAQRRPADAARAVSLLWEVGRRSWPKTVDIEIVSLMELNRILARAGRHGWSGVEKAAPIDPRVKKNLDLDVRISLAWDADNTDVDLHVTEPTGEHAFYGHRETRMGGLVSHDVTTGYGPEEYVVRRALPGAYDIQVHYYGSGQQTLVGPATLIATVYTNWGRPDEQRQVLTLRLDNPKDLDRIGVVKIGPRGALLKE
jgi:Ca-activated chloride channel family protein